MRLSSYTLVRSAYVGYIPREALMDDPDNEKHQKSSDVYVLKMNKELFAISCKNTYGCPLTNWWVDSYLHHCGLGIKYQYFKGCVAAREIDMELWNDNEKKYELDGKPARYKDVMRRKWKLEDVPNRYVGAEPAFKEHTPMHCIQTIFKDKESCLIILHNAMSDIFGQTLPYDFYLLAAGENSIYLQMNGYAPDMDSIRVTFNGPDSTSGVSAKFIFNASVDCRDIYDQIFRFIFKVEIRRSGGVKDYRIHFFLKSNEQLSGGEKTGGGSNVETGGGFGSSSAGGGGSALFRKDGGSRKRKSLRRRKTRRSKKN
jgi:hypothetical protein